jgi:ribonucleoside-triphosphate reductase (thioredoxin)
MDTYQKFIHLSRYARWDETSGKRESWEETVSRYVNFWGDKLDKDTSEELYNAIDKMEVMPSMRAMWSAGDALRKNNVAGFNCSFVAVDSPRAFDEALYILASGTGVGFSVESKFVSKLPIVNDTFTQTEREIVVGDSKEGWAKAIRKQIADLYLGQVHQWDYSKVRPAGARLKTMGGRASGPAPLMDLMGFLDRTFKGASGRKLNPIECHDIMCKIGEIIVVGGVRRSAMISLSDIGDPQVRDAKSGNWWEHFGHRALANNSACYEVKPDMETFLDEWTALVKSKSGERGIFSRVAAKAKAAENGRRETDWDFGTNPCSEIILRPNQFCNLSEVVAREEDTKASLKRKVRLATILGTLQATLTDLPYLRSVWKRNTAEESLLGVSLTGIQDCPLLQQPEPKFLEELRNVAIDTNKQWAALLGIPQSTAITCVKPSGTVSQLVNSASGIHGRFAPYYIRTVRQDNKDPITDFLNDVGVPNEPCAMKPDSTTIFSFPIKSPEGAILANEQNAIEQLENWKVYAVHWCEHKPSVTIYVREEEWLEVGSWVYDNFDLCSGISFLPYSDHTYAQAPYQDCSEEDYEAAFAAFPSQINFADLVAYEKEDNTEGAQTLACTAGGCEI